MGAAASPFNSLADPPRLGARWTAAWNGIAANAAKVAASLEAHARVESVCYPGLPSNPGHKPRPQTDESLWRRMLSFQVRGGYDEAIHVASRVKLFTNATSLGGTESLIEHRASSEGQGTKVPAELARVSVGLEHADDLIEDLMQALG